MSQQKVCQPLVCAISHRGSSLSCWNTVKKTIFPGKLPGPGLSTPAERAQVSCSRVIITFPQILIPFLNLCRTDRWWFRMSVIPICLLEKCGQYVKRMRLCSRCILWVIYSFIYFLMQDWTQNVIFWDYFLWAGLRQPWCRPSPSPGGFYDNLHSYQACSHSWPGNLKARRCWSCQFLQVLLRWGLQQGVALLPKSSKTERQKQNLEVQ